LKILRREGWFSVEELNLRIKDYKLYAYEQADKPEPLKKELKQKRLSGKAMSIMVLLREKVKSFFLGFLKHMYVI